MTAMPFTILIDGACPLCRREAAFMLRLDRGRQRLIIQDITEPAFDPAAIGCTTDQLMGVIHGIAPDGSLVTGLEVFRQAYTAVGYPWLLAWTRWPHIRPLADKAYLIFARNRLRMTGRGPCADGSCKLPPSA